MVFDLKRKRVAMTGRPFLDIVLLMCLSCFCQGCGYRLARPSNPLLENVHSISVKYFKNDTFEPELEKYFAHALVNEFVESRYLQVVDPAEADAILTGDIKKFEEDIVAYNSEGKAYEYRMFITLDVVLEDRKTGKVLWKRNNIRHSEEYPVDEDIVMSETAKRRAIKIFANDIAERVHDSIMQGF